MKTSIALCIAAASLAIGAEASVAARKRVLGANVQWRAPTESREFGRDAPGNFDDFLRAEEEIGRWLMASFSMSLPPRAATPSGLDVAAGDGLDVAAGGSIAGEATPRAAGPPVPKKSAPDDEDDPQDAAAQGKEEGGSETAGPDAVAVDVSDGGMTVDDAPSSEGAGSEAANATANATANGAERSAPASSASAASIAALSVVAALAGTGLFVL